MPQPSLATIETGKRDPGSSTIDRLLGATGHRIIAIPTLRASAADTAAAVEAALAVGNDSAAFRSLIQLCDDLSAEEGPVRIALCLTAAPLTGDRRYDAFIAATVEHYLAVLELPVPSWTSEPARFARPIWFVAGIPGFEADAYVTAPSSFVRHGVLINRSELASA